MNLFGFYWVTHKTMCVTQKHPTGEFWKQVSLDYGSEVQQPR